MRHVALAACKRRRAPQIFKAPQYPQTLAPSTLLYRVFFLDTLAELRAGSFVLSYIPCTELASGLFLVSTLTVTSLFPITQAAVFLFAAADVVD